MRWELAQFYCLSSLIYYSFHRKLLCRNDGHVSGHQLHQGPGGQPRFATGTIVRGCYLLGCVFGGHMEPFIRTNKQTCQDFDSAGESWAHFPRPASLGQVHIQRRKRTDPLQDPVLCSREKCEKISSCLFDMSCDVLCAPTLLISF